MKILLDNYKFERIKYFDEVENIDLALRIYKSNEEFFNMLSKEEIGKREKITKNSVTKDLELTPPGIDYEDKFFGLVYSMDKDLVGVLDLINGYPRKDIMYIGLFVIDGKLHRLGHGKKLFGDLMHMARDNNFSAIMLGVLKENKKAQDFWKAMGFKIVKDNKTFIEMKKDL